MTVKQRRQRTAIVGIEAFPQAVPFNGALDQILAKQEPFPAFVVDRRWSLLRANRAAARLTEFLAGPTPPGPAPQAAPNLADALISPDGLRPFIVNWEEVALHFLKETMLTYNENDTQATRALREWLDGAAGGCPPIEDAC